ncbi:MAG: VIT1/CCC1 transporter family protein [Crocinitomicaceae bacterium]|nr:VIT1/CCC1 transporter family protein [Crocinitomicaceae bacterium]
MKKSQIQTEVDAYYLYQKLAENEADPIVASVFAHEVLVKEELVINAVALKGSAMEAALSSFFLFAIGAIIPVLPFMFTTGMKAIF